MLRKIYEGLVLGRPAFTLSLVMLVTAFLGYHAFSFRLDASSETLVLENDTAIQYYRDIKDRYGSDDYLLVTYTPRYDDLFESKTLLDLKDLHDSLAALNRVTTVTSILNVPLVQSPPISLKGLGQSVQTLGNPEINIALARQELTTSPIYKDLLISRDGLTTAFVVVLADDQTLQELIETLETIRQQPHIDPTHLSKAESAYKAANEAAQKQQQLDIISVRSVLKNYQGAADIHLGGVPMIASDSIDFIRNDLRIFGLGVLGILIILLAAFFRKVQWVLLPMLTCACAGICVIGFLGLMNWPVTIVSSNFISLLLIFTLSFCVHQIVKYRECLHKNPHAPQHVLLKESVVSIAVPCAFMVFTTMVAFGSLVISDIRPIIDFGLMMTFGLGASFVIAFTVMPAALMFLPPEKEVNHYDYTARITHFFARLVQTQGKIILSIFVIIVAMSVWGMSFLNVQNRFIDYYKPSTEIYRGMEVIDNKLGGTTPLDIIIDAPKSFIDFQKEDRALMEEEGFGIPEEPSLEEGYWFSEEAIEDIKLIHEYLESLPEIGKVLSLHTSLNMLSSLEDAQKLDRFYLGVVYNQLPPTVRDLLLTPYVSGDGNQLRFGVRVYESREGLNREDLLAAIKGHLTTTAGLASEQVRQTGMVVLYNNVLQSLFRSQILTIGFVFVAMFVMFVLLFRNIRIAMVAIIPNMTITAFVLGIMGWFGIPLDIMTITIAAICFGIADDDTIHYVHRFMEEFSKTGQYRQAVQRSHATIGRAMYYTSMTIMFGFSILAFSNFVPTFYFGILTGVSMLAALLADITLLPLLLMLFKPMGPERRVLSD